MIDQWEKLKHLFDTALNLSDQEREAFLQGISAEDPELCANLKRLIEQHEAAGNFLGGDNTVPLGTFVPGQTVAGRYRIVRQLGRGGMGEVHEALDTALDEKIALKTVRQDAAVDSAIGTRLIQELQLTRKVTHPNVCRVHDIGRHIGTDGNIIFFTMELLHGETLAARLEREGKLTPEVTLSIARRIADGLDAAHACGIVHRDLKPSNIMATDGGRIVIMDFGLARDSEYASGGFASRESRLFGTPGYISPEQVAGGRATGASDIYAFGVVLHEMLS
jgi:serine/threonine protein kinase